MKKAAGQESLFARAPAEGRAAAEEGGAPLADLCRPAVIDEIVGQEHLLGPGMILRRAVERGDLFSMILWGQPGTGKTTIALAFARAAGHLFVPFSAVLGGVKDVRRIVEQAREDRRARRVATILFVDEIHRFNRAQQDAFLPHVEKGTITLVGATTENPSFALNSPLLSRCRVLLLKPLGEESIAGIVRRAAAFVAQRSGRAIGIDDAVAQGIAKGADGDARRAVNTLEVVLRAACGGACWLPAAGGEERGGEPPPAGPVRITKEEAAIVLERDSFLYDRSGEEHYNTISAFIKSMRGTDPDAAIYYMVRMLEGGEDPLFILRRMLIFAAEDVGLADPNALTVAASAMTAFERVGLPEGAIPMAEAALYLAAAPKSNSAIRALGAARAAVRETGPLPIPLHLRNPVTALMKELGYGSGYTYPHDAQAHWVPERYLPDALAGTAFYEPSAIGQEREIGARIEKIRRYLKEREADGGKR